MGYVIEPKGVDLVVGPSILTEENEKIIAESIAKYRTTGKQPVSVPIIQIGSDNRKNKQVKIFGKPANAAI